MLWQLAKIDFITNCRGNTRYRISSEKSERIDIKPVCNLSFYFSFVYVHRVLIMSQYVGDP